MTKTSTADEGNRRAWTRPTLVRMDAADAENMAGNGSDMMSMHSMNS